MQPFDARSRSTPDRRGWHSFLQIGVRLQPSIDIPVLDRDYAAVVARFGHFRRRLVGDGGERQQVIAIIARPSSPQVGDQDVLTGLGSAFEDDVLVFFILGAFQLRQPVPADVFV